MADEKDNDVIEHAGEPGREPLRGESPGGEPPCRRTFLVWAAAALTGAAGVVASLGSQVLAYIIGPRLKAPQKAELIRQQQQALEAEQKLLDLQLQRINSTEIAVARLDDFDEQRGHMVTDFFLLPAVIFKAGKNQCIAYSAVCTHLGCTVQPDLVDGKIFCPCHMSYFDLQSGKPLSGPATIPLSREPIEIRGDMVYLKKPDLPIKIGPSQKPLSPV